MVTANDSTSLANNSSDFSLSIQPMRVAPFGGAANQFDTILLGLHERF
jgi:hypothetical protein